MYFVQYFQQLVTMAHRKLLISDSQVGPLFDELGLKGDILSIPGLSLANRECLPADDTKKD